jgi:hypothetical protein
MAPKKPWIPDYTIKDARLMWRNFAGIEAKYNAKGNRNFTIFLTPEDSENLTRMGLNVKTLPIRDEDPDDKVAQDILKVKVNFKGRPPRLVLVTHKGRTQLDEDTAMLLDAAYMKNVDLILSPYWWDVDGKEGVAVSIKAIYMTIVEDELEMMYSDLPDATGNINNLDYTPDEEEESNGPRFR